MTLDALHHLPGYWTGGTIAVWAIGVALVVAIAIATARSYISHPGDVYAMVVFVGIIVLAAGGLTIPQYNSARHDTVVNTIVAHVEDTENLTRVGPVSTDERPIMEMSELYFTATNDDGDLLGVRVTFVPLGDDTQPLDGDDWIAVVTTPQDRSRGDD